MGTRVQALAAEITPPRQGEQIALASTTTTAFFDLRTPLTATPGDMSTPFCGRFLTLEAEGGDVYIAVTKGNASPANDLNPATTGIAPAAGMCTRIAAGTSKTFWADGASSDWRYLAHRTASGTGTLRIWPSSRPELAR